MSKFTGPFKITLNYEFFLLYFAGIAHYERYLLHGHFPVYEVTFRGYIFKFNLILVSLIKKLRGMKHLPIGLRNAFLCFMLACCSKDNPSDNTPINSPVTGTWELTALIINPAQDIDNDGTTTTNILSELDCVTGTLTIKSDATWSSDFSGVNVTGITSGLFIISCSNNAQINSGTWQLKSNQLTLFRETTSTFFMLDGTTLTNTVGEDLPGFRSEVYEKQ